MVQKKWSGMDLEGQSILFGCLKSLWIGKNESEKAKTGVFLVFETKIWHENWLLNGFKSENEVVFSHKDMKFGLASAWEGFGWPKWSLLNALEASELAKTGVFGQKTGVFWSLRPKFDMKSDLEMVQNDPNSLPNSSRVPNDHLESQFAYLFRHRFTFLKS